MITHNKHYIWAKLWHFKFIKTHRKDSSFLSILCVTLGFRIWKYTKLLSAEWLNWNPSPSLIYFNHGKVGFRNRLHFNAHKFLLSFPSFRVHIFRNGQNIHFWPSRYAFYHVDAILRTESRHKCHQKRYEICCLLRHFRLHLFISVSKISW